MTGVHASPAHGAKTTTSALHGLLRDLATIAQPLAGETATRRDVFDHIKLEACERIHRNRPLVELRRHARAVLDAVLTRV